jgi:predicted homoserine dehydrogenase-like protein
VFIVDTALKKRVAEGRPVQVGIFGAGYMARAIALQIETHTPGMRVAAIANRTPARAHDLLTGLNADPVACETADQIDDAIKAGRAAVTADPHALAQAEGIDVVVEGTGTIDYGLEVVLASIAAGKHVVLLNAEIDGLLGPILKKKADAAGVVITCCAGDEPGVAMNLHRYVVGMGVRPVLNGHTKGFHNVYRTPATQQAYADEKGLDVKLATSACDGTKISFEQAVIANATGMGVAKRGMIVPEAPPGTRVEDLGKLYAPHLDFDGPGIVDYVIGTDPLTAVFIYGVIDDPRHHALMEYYKMGPGPLYCFYWPTHLVHLEAATTIARTVLFNDPTGTPLGGPVVGVASAAKSDLKAGETLDGMGGFTAYGLCDNADVMSTENLLPIALADGCRLVKPVAKDAVIRWDDVVCDAARPALKLYREQEALFGLRAPEAARSDAPEAAFK